jgi:hypothetical protein
VNADQMWRAFDELQFRVQQLTERVTALEAGKLGGPQAPKYIPMLPNEPMFVPVKHTPTSTPTVDGLPDISAGICCGDGSK